MTLWLILPGGSLFLRACNYFANITLLIGQTANALWISTRFILFRINVAWVCNDTSNMWRLQLNYSLSINKMWHHVGQLDITMIITVLFFYTDTKLTFSYEHVLSYQKASVEIQRGSKQINKLCAYGSKTIPQSYKIPESRMFTESRDKNDYTES